MDVTDDGSVIWVADPNVLWSIQMITWTRHVTWSCDCITWSQTTCGKLIRWVIDWYHNCSIVSIHASQRCAYHNMPPCSKTLLIELFDHPNDHFQSSTSRNNLHKTIHNLIWSSFRTLETRTRTKTRIQQDQARKQKSNWKNWQNLIWMEPLFLRNNGFY